MSARFQETRVLHAGNSNKNAFKALIVGEYSGIIGFTCSSGSESNHASASLEPNYQPPVTFVVVQKRQHTRLFANNYNGRQTIDRSGNILPGTMGTSRPAHYHVLWDEKKFTTNGLQSLTNNLCYTCTRSVSIVPPAYYSHLSAFRARFYMEPETSNSASMASGASGRGGGAVARGGPRAPGAGAGAAVRPLSALKGNVKKAHIDQWIDFSAMEVDVQEDENNYARDDDDLQEDENNYVGDNDHLPVDGCADDNQENELSGEDEQAEC
ncbi:hypothetical protein C5167_031335 [Papaver somniferum]|uniref:Piwi domain-containing protein n=1 Tax=Papaver somniferum TaxID=3469 RepID=A0A4Y7K586_PAPSO|nr:hypothetical protein C5167_031335 [Papaver somniferum]